MKLRVFISLLCLLAAAVGWNTGLGYAIGPPVEPFPQAAPTSSIDFSGKTPGPPSSLVQQIPAKAHAVLKAIQDRGGDPLPGYVGGRIFQNRERRLPRGNYREYDVEPRRRGKNRGAERIVIERQTGKAYYTGDHYRTFVPMN
ncbi:MAG TPA: ribonuclease domain-containing protein [Nitrospiraceae bacterium]|nr:ribonuclease domain-containing protein [Nitrospiraceae bacterium]